MINETEQQICCLALLEILDASAHACSATVSNDWQPFPITGMHPQHTEWQAKQPKYVHGFLNMTGLLHQLKPHVRRIKSTPAWSADATWHSFYCDLNCCVLQMKAESVERRTLRLPAGYIFNTRIDESTKRAAVILSSVLEGLLGIGQRLVMLLGTTTVCCSYHCLPIFCMPMIRNGLDTSFYKHASDVQSRTGQCYHHAFQHGSDNRQRAAVLLFWWTIDKHV